MPHFETIVSAIVVTFIVVTLVLSGAAIVIAISGYIQNSWG